MKRLHVGRTRWSDRVAAVSAGPAVRGAPAARRAPSVACRAAYALAFLWLSVATHLILVYGPDRARPIPADAPIAPACVSAGIDAARAEADPLSRALRALAASLIAAPRSSAPTAPVASTSAPAPSAPSPVTPRVRPL